MGKNLISILAPCAVSFWFFIWLVAGIEEPYQQQISPPHCYEANKALQAIIKDQKNLQVVIEKIKNKQNPTGAKEE